MRSIASLAGEYTIDNRGTPGIKEELVIAQGLPSIAAKGLFEDACYTCSHCQTIVVQNRERTRPRGFCKKCSHVICDPCDAKYVASGHKCMPFNAVVDEFLNNIDRGDSAPVALALAEAHFDNAHFLISNPEDK